MEILPRCMRNSNTWISYIEHEELQSKLMIQLKSYWTFD